MMKIKNAEEDSKEPVVLTIKVKGASNVRGSKGEHVNSFVRVQFADFDYREVISCFQQRQS